MNLQICPMPASAARAILASQGWIVTHDNPVGLECVCRSPRGDSLAVLCVAADESGRVGADFVPGMVESLRPFEVQGAFVVTDGYFSDEVREISERWGGVMELVDGQSLARCFAALPPPPADAPALERSPTGGDRAADSSLQRHGVDEVSNLTIEAKGVSEAPSGKMDMVRGGVASAKTFAEVWSQAPSTTSLPKTSEPPARGGARSTEVKLRDLANPSGVKSTPLPPVPLAPFDAAEPASGVPAGFMKVVLAAGIPALALCGVLIFHFAFREAHRPWDSRLGNFGFSPPRGYAAPPAVPAEGRGSLSGALPGVPIPAFSDEREAGGGSSSAEPPRSQIETVLR